MATTRLPSNGETERDGRRIEAVACSKSFSTPRSVFALSSLEEYDKAMEENPAKYVRLLRATNNMRVSYPVERLTEDGKHDGYSKTRRSAAHWIVDRGMEAVGGQVIKITIERVE